MRVYTYRCSYICVCAYTYTRAEICASACAYIRAYTYIYKRITCIYARMRMSIQTDARARVYAGRSTNVRTYVDTYVRVRVLPHVRACVYSYVRADTHTYVCACIYKPARIYKRSSALCTLHMPRDATLALLLLRCGRRVI